MVVDLPRWRAKTWGAAIKEIGVTRLAANPMNVAAWRQALADLCRQAGEADAEDQADFLRVARTLLAVAPASAPSRFDHLPGRARFEALLTLEAWESAALALLPSGAGYLFSRGSDGCSIASLVLADCAQDTTAEGDSPALALICALAGAVMAGMVAGADAGGAMGRAEWLTGGDEFGVEEPWHVAPALLH